MQKSQNLKEWSNEQLIEEIYLLRVENSRLERILEKKSNDYDELSKDFIQINGLLSFIKVELIISSQGRWYNWLNPIKWVNLLKKVKQIITK